MEFFEKDFGKILKTNAQELRHDLLPQGTNCFRVYDRNLVQFPVTVDLYGKYAKVTDYGEDGPLSADMLSSCVDLCARMLYLEHENVIYSYRAKRAQGEQHEKAEDNSLETVVNENNLQFKVNLATYVDTGLFLDHRLTRMLIRERSLKADVLNLFSYTGSFSVYAAAGGANSVKSIDMSATYTKWAEENLAQNGFEGDSYQCVCMDATKYIAQAVKLGEKYDIIIFDPPSFSNSRKMDGDFDVARDYVKWIKDLVKLLKKTGFILFSTNLGSFRMDRRQLRGLSVKEITGAVQAPGFIKGRKGTTRSWMMALDDDSLKLDWSEPSEKPKKESVKSSDKRASERKPYEKKAYEKRSYESRGGERDKSYGARNYGSRDRHFSNDDYRPRRSYDNRYHDEKASSYDRQDRDYRSRDFHDSNEYRGDRPSYRSRLERNSERGGYDRYHSTRENHDDRNYRSYRNEHEDRGGRGFKSERNYEHKDYSERPRYEKNERFDRKDRDRRSSFKEGSTGSRSSSTPYKGRDDKSSKGKKPYGYDSFKSARSRDDSADFFWNTDDLD